jgi:ribosomal protein S18 acetylase RimI-like enzyme
MNSLFERVYSEVDSLRFGVKVAKINDEKFLSEEVFQLLKEEGVQLIMSRVRSEDIALINFLEDNNFRTKDVQLTYRFDLAKGKINHAYANSALLIREATAADASDLEAIAADCFSGYGHYFADKKLNEKAVVEVYKDWTSRAIHDSDISDKFFLAEHQGKIAGYLSFKERITENGVYSFGGIGAVGKKFQSANVFSSLTIKGLEWGLANNHLWQEHNVLNVNYPVNRVFSKLGFYIYKSETTLHAWL